jgi:hypothetical protein
VQFSDILNGRWPDKVRGSFRKKMVVCFRNFSDTKDRRQIT